MALYQRSQQYTSEIRNLSSNLKTQIKELEAAVEGSKFSAHAHHVLEGEVQEEDVIISKHNRSRKVCLDLSLFYWCYITS